MFVGLFSAGFELVVCINTGGGVTSMGSGPLDEKKRDSLEMQNLPSDTKFDYYQKPLRIDVVPSQSLGKKTIVFLQI